MIPAHSPVRSFVSRRLKSEKQSSSFFESIYANKGTMGDAMDFSLIEPENQRLGRLRFSIFSRLGNFFSTLLFRAITLTWFSVYFVTASLLTWTYARINK
jgi:hypothetical protein